MCVLRHGLAFWDGDHCLAEADDSLGLQQSRWSGMIVLKRRGISINYEDLGIPIWCRRDPEFWEHAMPEKLPKGCIKRILVAIIVARPRVPWRCAWRPGHRVRFGYAGWWSDVRRMVGMIEEGGIGFQCPGPELRTVMRKGLGEKKGNRSRRNELINWSSWQPASCEVIIASPRRNAREIQLASTFTTSAAVMSMIPSSISICLQTSNTASELKSFGLPAPEPLVVVMVEFETFDDVLEVMKDQAVGQHVAQTPTTKEFPLHVDSLCFTAEPVTKLSRELD
ncbi:hypothetical protein GGX14DRAFT_396950 [Mycena pura]|uniref:Uncharacterized protein n=1 Tax=Mycena pura TaxID=153505 RepID=A0AAD6YF52_9AGAR|nr:hypothetical protein GGX14DRAFT_396950 [Mycena pura]